MHFEPVRARQPLAALGIDLEFPGSTQAAGLRLRGVRPRSAFFQHANPFSRNRNAAQISSNTMTGKSGSTTSRFNANGFAEPLSIPVLTPGVVVTADWNPASAVTFITRGE